MTSWLYFALAQERAPHACITMRRPWSARLELRHESENLSANCDCPRDRLNEGGFKRPFLSVPSKTAAQLDLHVPVSS
jgi:hypothetical protein